MLHMLSSETLSQLRAFSRNRRVDMKPLATEVRRTSTRLLPDGTLFETPVGMHWQSIEPVIDQWVQLPGWMDKMERCKEFIANAEPDNRSCINEVFQSFINLFPDRIALLDLETCGFAGSVVFQAGIMLVQDGQLQLVQLLAKDYSQEPSLLYQLRDLLQPIDVLVTFNGKSFDWPVVQDRCIMHRLDQSHPELMNQMPTVHCDLLHHSRRHWKKMLPNCKLQTIETYVCDRHRAGDIPGRDIPSAYHDYVRTGDAWQMRSVLHHNALDLITSLEIAMKIACYETSMSATVPTTDPE